jgi:hypothetical protein
LICEEILKNEKDAEMVVVSHKVYRIAGIKMLRQSKEGTREEAGK